MKGRTCLPTVLQLTLEQLLIASLDSTVSSVMHVPVCPSIPLHVIFVLCTPLHLGCAPEPVRHYTQSSQLTLKSWDAKKASNVGAQWGQDIPCWPGKEEVSQSTWKAGIWI